MAEWRHFVLAVNPEPWAVGPLSVGRRGGKVFPQMGRNAQLHAFKEAVKEGLGSGHEMIEGRVMMRLAFSRRRDEYTTPQARTHRKHEADVTNMQKATEDACQGILFKNDKDVKWIASREVEQSETAEPFIIVSVKPWDAADWRLDYPEDVLALVDELGFMGGPSALDDFGPPDHYFGPPDDRDYVT